MKNESGMRRASRPEQRAARAADASRLLAQALDTHDVTQEEVAAHLGVSQCTISRLCSRHSPESLALHDVPELPDAVAVDVLRPVVARLGYALAQLPIATDAQGAGGELSLLARVASESAQAVAAVAVALQRGHDRAVVMSAHRECTEAIEALLAVQARIAQQLADLDAVARPAVRAVAR